MFLKIRPSPAWISVVIGLGAAVSTTPAIAGDHFFHKGQLLAVPATAATVPAQQVAVAAPAPAPVYPAVQTVPVQMTYIQPAVAYAQLAPMAAVQMSYVPVAVQAVPQPATYTFTIPAQAPVAPAAPQINIKLEAQPPTAAPEAAPQASAQNTQAPVASFAPQTPVLVTQNIQGQTQVQVQAQAVTPSVVTGAVVAPAGAIPMQLYYLPGSHGLFHKFGSIHVLGVR
jgi:hypothetical protein